MDLKERLKNKIFKSYINSSIEYHAGGFFVRKRATYLFFFENSCVYYYEREEGLHPWDNKYEKLIEEVERIGKVEKYELYSFDDSYLIYLNPDKTIRLVPSIFVENLIYENLTEILIDWGNNTTQIFNCVYENLRAVNI